ncbi:hypothetical protein L914_02258 [Phytophthora nicotianae]|uniref:Uncharacterized protein n=1 Tax=Phytophthora nicotianae TaxID=4792 RepID=W2P124_PHYNI|nr:hypothetical protein L914_02258 [Phytophthora nicotianae]
MMRFSPWLTATDTDKNAEQLGAVRSYVIRLSGIQFFDTNENPLHPKRAEMVGITLHGAKNNPFGREEVRYHYKSKDRLLCPVRAAQWVYKAATTFVTRPGDPALLMWNSGITYFGVD